MPYLWNVGLLLITYHYTLYTILQCQAPFGKTVFIFPIIPSYRVSTFEYLASLYIIVEIKEKPPVTETDLNKLELQFHEPYRSKKVCKFFKKQVQSI